MNMFEEERLRNAAARREQANLDASEIYVRSAAFRARPENTIWTLQTWTDAGRPMLSNGVAAWLCQVARANERQLRAMTLDAIMSIPAAGNVAAQEFARYHAKTEAGF